MQTSGHSENSESSDTSPDSRWAFAPLITFRDGSNLSITEGAIPSQIVGSLGIYTKFSREGIITHRKWALWRYEAGTGVPGSATQDKAVDQFYGWWEQGQDCQNQQNGFVSGLGEFGAVLLPNRVWKDRPGKYVRGSSHTAFVPEEHTWQHFLAACGTRWAKKNSDDSFEIALSLRSACGLPTKEGLPEHGGFEVPLIIRTGFGSDASGTPFIKIGTPYELKDGVPRWLRIEWKWVKDSTTNTDWWQRSPITGEMKLFEGDLNFVHAGSSDSKGRFWWATPPGISQPADIERGRVYTTYLDRHNISWLKYGSTDSVAVQQTPVYIGQTHLELPILKDGFISQPDWQVRVHFPDSQNVKAKCEPLFRQWSENFLSAAASGLATDSVSFFPKFGVLRFPNASKHSQWHCSDDRGSGEEGLAFSEPQPNAFDFSIEKAEFPRVQGSMDIASRDCGLLSANLVGPALPRDIFGNPDLELFLTKKSKVRATSAQILRDNALQLEIDVSQEHSLRGHFRVGWHPVHGCSESNDSGQRVFVQISDFSIPLTSVLPVTQDTTPELKVSSLRDYEARDFRSDPLLVRLDDDADHGDGYHLVVNEAVRPPRSRNLAMEIKVNPSNKPVSLGKRVLVLDPHPFTVAATLLPDFNFLNSAESGRVLARRIYDSDSGVPVWRLAVDTEVTQHSLRLLFPPQAVGEEALLLKKTTQGPYYDMRLGACALAVLDPSYFDQRYAPVPWDLRWILGRPGERDTGARVKELHFELLYGLQSTFVADPREFPIRLAEVTSRLGDWPGGVPDLLPWDPTDEQNNAFTAMRQLYGRLAKLFVARLGLFELGSLGYPDGVELSKGLSVRPRVAEAAEGSTQPRGAQLRLLPLSYTDVDKRIKDLHPPETNPDESNGLPGGFEWGMQEWGLPWIRSFWNNSDASSSALVRKLSISALGGYGHQIARFMNDRIIIEVHVSQGRTMVYTVERIGRIAVFWNKAKHVIRYERSTVPAPEFTTQDKELGKPVLRKVDEYIEILQDRREYPDQAAGQPIHTGPVKACVFPKAGYQIRIRSGWGRTLDDPNSGTGKWEVPLWQPGADPERFPKPEIHLELLTKRSASESAAIRSGKGAGAPVGEELVSFFQTISHPEDIYFYTDGAEHLGGDPGAWPPVMHVDYGDTFEPEENWGLPAKIDLGNAEFPDALSNAPGMRRYSFRLEPAQDETVLTVHRQEMSQVRGRMRAASMVRGLPLETEQRVIDPDPKFDRARNAAKAEKDVVSARGDLGFGVAELVERVRKGERPNGAAIRDEVKLLLKTRKFPEPPTSMPELCAWDGSASPPVLFYILNKTAGDLRNQVANFLYSRSEHIFTRIETMRSKGADRLQALIDDMEEEIERSIHQLQGVEPPLSFDLESVTRPYVEQVEHALSELQLQADSVSDAVLRHVGDAEREIEHWVKEIGSWEKAAVSVRARSLQTLDQLATSLDALKNKVQGLQLPNIDVADLAKLIGAALGKLRTTKMTFGQNFDSALDQLQDTSNAPIDRGRAFIKVLREATETMHLAVSRAIDQLIFELQCGFVRKIREALQGQLDAIQKRAKQHIGDIISVLNQLRTDVGMPADDLLAKIDHALYKARTERTAMLDAAMGEVDEFIRTYICPIFKGLCRIDLGLPNLFDREIAEVILTGIAVSESVDRLADAILNANDGNIEPVLDEAKNLANQLNHQLGYYTEIALDHVRDIYEKARQVDRKAVSVLQEGEPVLRAARAVTEAFTAPGLDFNRSTVALAYKTGESIRDIATTPVISKMKELNQHLNALGLNLPVSGLSDRFLPDISLPTLDFNQILKDIGGTNLTGMFKGLKMPEEFGEILKVRHGVDKETMRAWVKADIDDYMLAKDATVFALGPVKVRVQNARLDAHVSMEADTDKRMRKDARGSITATWVMDVGAELVAFEDTQLIFDNGRMDFRIQPQKVRMSGLLKMLSDAASAMSAEEDGFYIGLMKQGEIPVGMKAIMELPAISVGTTPVALTNLQIGAFLELRALDENLNFSFTLGAGVHLSRKDAPFSVAIFCLGGGGWVDAAVRYTGNNGALESDISVGVDAAASLDVNLGVVSGCVRISLGIFVEYHCRRSTGSQLLVGVRLMIEGRVDVLGVIEVYLALMLEGTYDGQKLIGRGSVKLRIKICWCFTLKVEKSVTCSFGNTGGGPATLAAASNNAPYDYEQAALDYLNSLE